MSLLSCLTEISESSTVKDYFSLESYADNSGHVTIQSAYDKSYQQYSLNCPYVIAYMKVSGDELSGIGVSPYNVDCSLSCISTNQELLSRPLHKHDYIELTYVISGTMTSNIDGVDVQYNHGECCLLNDRVLHSESVFGDYQALFVSIPTSVLSERCLSSTHASKLIDPDNINRKEYINYIPVLPVDTMADVIEDIFEKIITETFHYTTGSSFIIHGLLIRLLTILEDDKIYRRIWKSEKSELSEDLFAEVTRFLERNRGRFNRDELKQSLHYSPDYLNRVVKRHAGLTLVEYGRVFMFKEAASLLVRTDLSISKIVESLGFSNRTHFNKLFVERYGITPAEYRKKYASGQNVTR